MTRVLGVLWNTNTDQLAFKISSVEYLDSISTRRELLRFTASIFYPLGILSPLVNLKTEGPIPKGMQGEVNLGS